MMTDGSMGVQERIKNKGKGKYKRMTIKATIM